MSCKRSALIIIYFALFGFFAADSWARKPGEQAIATARVNEVNGVLKSAQQDLNSPSSISSEGLGLAIAERTTSTAPVTSPADVSVPGSESGSLVISRGLCWGAIGITSLVCLLLLRLLFKQPQPSTKSAGRKSQPVEAKTTVIETQTRTLTEKQKLSDYRLRGNISSSSVVTKLDSTLDRKANNGNDSMTSASQAQVKNAKLIDGKKSVPDLPASNYRDRSTALAVTPTPPPILIESSPQVDNSESAIKAATQVARGAIAPVNRELFAQLQDRDPQIRLKALKDLKQLYQFAAPGITQIAAMQSDSDYEIRQTATQALRELNVNPLPPLSTAEKFTGDRLLAPKAGQTNLHLVAYLLADLDTDE
ncbi:MAG: hypothetical protein AAFQ41_09680 [Cyanobacteria bacterium J06623_7]